MQYAMACSEFLKAALASTLYLFSCKDFPASMTGAADEVGIATGADYAKAVAPQLTSLARLAPASSPDMWLS